MKTLIAFLALVVLFTVTACGDDFDEEAEKEAVVAVSVGIDEDFANADREAVLAACHEEYVGFYSSPDGYGSETYQDFGPDAFSDPGTGRWDDYEVYVSPDLAVIYGNRTFVHPVHGSFKSFGTALFIKEDGQWMLIHGHNSYAGP